MKKKSKSRELFNVKLSKVERKKITNKAKRFAKGNISALMRVASQKYNGPKIAC